MAEQAKVNNTVEQKAPVKQVTLYDQAMEVVQSLVPKDKFRFNRATSGTSIFDTAEGRGTRLLKVVESKKGLRVEFNVDIAEQLKDVPGNEKMVFSEKDAKDKHMGTCRWIYTGSDIKKLEDLVKASLAGFAPKVKEPKKKKEEAPKQEAEKKEEPKQEVPKQQEKPKEQAPPKADRPLTPEEKKQLVNGKVEIKIADEKKRA